MKDIVLALVTMAKESPGVVWAVLAFIVLVFGVANLQELGDQAVRLVSAMKGCP